MSAMYDIMSSCDKQKSAGVYPLETGAFKKKRLLLHCCCAPCASYVITRLIEEYEITLFFYNPNIEPYEEYAVRKKELEKLAIIYSLHFKEDIKILDCEYDNAKFVGSAYSFADEPEGKKRCKLCFDIRLGETARVAKELSFDIFTTTLSVSPYKNAAILNDCGIRQSREHDTAYLEANFKKNDGYKKSIELSKKYGLYRQNYCGCSFSKRQKDSNNSHNGQ